MTQATELIDMTDRPRRGRPLTGVRKLILQVPMDPEDYETIRLAAKNEGRNMAEIARDLMKGDIAWSEVVNLARQDQP